VPAGVPTAFGFPPDVDPRVMEEVPSLVATLASGHAELAHLSRRGSLRQVLGTGHYIPTIRPGVVIEAIDEMIDGARASEPH